MVPRYVLSLILTVQLIHFAYTKRIAKKIIVVEDFGNCPQINANDMTLKVHYIKFGMISGSKSEINFKLETARNITGKLYGPVNVMKCPTVHGDEDCETYLVIKIKDFCQKFLEKNQAWSFAFDNIQPLITCPIQAGIYESKGSPDLEKLKWLIDDSHVFKIYIHILENEKYMACVRIVFKSNIVRVYVKDT